MASQTVKNYVPRHIRLGTIDYLSEPRDSFREVLENVPIIDENGRLIESRSSLKKVPAMDVMAAYRPEDFNLASMLDAGVPLKTMEMLRSPLRDMEQIQNYAERLDALDSYAKTVEQSHNDFLSQFDLPVESSNPS